MLSPVSSKIYEFAEFRLIPDEGLLLRDGVPVNLNPKAFDVLVMLVRNHGHLVTKSEILDSIWEGAAIEEGAVAKAVWFVRNALGDTSKERFITTIPRRGYRFVAPVSIASQSSGAFRLPLLPDTVDPDRRDVFPQATANGDALPAESAVDLSRSEKVLTAEPLSNTIVSNTPAGQPGYSSRRFRWLASAGFTGLLLLGVLLYVGFGGGNFLGSARASRIAVLPLKPLDVQSRDALYELGIAEALILKLSSRKELVVRPLSAVRGYTDVNEDALAAGKQQNVDYVLSSNYQISGGRIKVSSQLLNVATGSVEATYRTDHPLDSSFTAQDATANDIGNRLLAKFGSGTGDFRAKRGTDNQEAYRLYMMGMNLSDERGIQNLQKALGYLEQAVDLDPNYALAWAGIAHLHRDFVGHSDPDAKGHYEKSMEAIRRSLAIDPNISEAYSALCHNKNRYEYDAVGAEAACKRAVELDPDSPQAHKIYANFLYSRGRFDEAIASIRTAMDLQPVSYSNQQIYGLALYYARRYEQAEAQFKQLLDLNPNHNFINNQLVKILEAQGKESEAFEYLLKSLNGKKADDATIERYKTAYAQLGWRGVTLERIKDETRLFELACLYARIGDKDRAFEYLEKAYQERNFLIAILQVAPYLDPLRDDPRYADLVRRIEQN